MGINNADYFIVTFQCESKRCLIIGNIYFIKLRIVPVTQYLNSEIQNMLHAINYWAYEPYFTWTRLYFYFILSV